jgi:thiol-disulfide isomerase/thioredoxin
MTGSLLGIVLAVAAAPSSTPLTIGSPAPKLGPLTFVRGEPVGELARGTVYVIEFSGVECVPCRKAIPLLNDLQKAHPGVVVVSVFYGDEEKAVRAFLADKGKAAQYRVAVDSTGATWKAWFAAALLVGIPHAFVVDAAGKVAWIGYLDDLGDALGRIVAGTFDPRADVMRLRVEQGAALRERRLEEREEAGRAEYNRVNDLVIAGKLPEALAATDRALPRYAGCPQATERLRGMKTYLLANLPGRQEEAVALATDLAIEARLSGQCRVVARTADAFLDAAGRAAPAARDQRLVDLAIVLLAGPEPADLRGKPVGEAQRLRASTLETLARAYHLRGDRRRAIATVQEALAATEKQRPDPGTDEAQFAARQKRTIEYLKGRLAEFQRADERPAK